MIGEASRDGLVFVDSNVWLYALISGQDQTKHQVAQTLLNSGRFLISTQVVNEVCVNLLRKVSPPEDEIAQLIRSFYETHEVVVLTQTIQLMASDLRSKYSFSYWDSLIVAAALQSDSTLLFSEDMQHGLVIEDQMAIMNPFL